MNHSVDQKYHISLKSWRVMGYTQIDDREFGKDALQKMLETFLYNPEKAKCTESVFKSYPDESVELFDKPQPHKAVELFDKCMMSESLGIPYPNMINSNFNRLHGMPHVNLRREYSHGGWIGVQIDLNSPSSFLNLMTKKVASSKKKISEVGNY